MKIFKKNPFKSQFISKGNSRNKKMLIAAGEIVAFLMSYNVISNSLSPDSMMAKEIRQVNVSVDSLGGKYLGPTVNGLYKGQGEFQYLKGGTYNGEFSASKRSGNGTFIWQNGDKYVGTWKDDNMDEGTYTFKNGRVYKGTFKDNKFFKGHVDFGNTVSNYGLSSLSLGIDNAVIIAVICKFQNGTYYNGALNGLAEIKYSSGNKYNGEVVNGNREGSGVFTWMSGETHLASYSGHWRNNLMDGKGIYYYSSSTYPRLEGNFENGKPSSYMSYEKEAGKRYSTKWKDGKCIDNGG